MKYERLTKRDKNGDCHLWDDTVMGAFNALDHLAELEDKIESGEIVSVIQSEQGEQEIAYFVKHNAAVRKQAVIEFAERVKMAFYYEFDELIPSTMADKIDELVKEVCGE